jgi:2-oxoglutarate/2-oxoacid ferredoxin oxidoreductase subunit alpha
MTKSALNWKVTGAAGEGIKSTGLLFSKTCLHNGLFTFDYTDYPSLIRGGHNTYQVLASNSKVFAQEKEVDLLICLNQNGLEFNLEEVSQKGVVLIDATDTNTDLSIYNDKRIIDVPFYKLALDAGVDRVMANNVAIGCSLFILGLPLDKLNQVIASIFKDKGEKVIDLNQTAAKVGFDYALKHIPPLDYLQVTPQKPIDSISLTGNEAISLGAIAGGMKAYIAYPMTPSSSILHVLAGWAEKAMLMVKHAEDEIGVVNMALGASFAGVRAAVGTSGGGFCYMTEAFGLAGVAELPIVFFECQRPGPALGMPTWTAQADLLFVINASQDEFPRIVLSPGDVNEAFELARLSFQLAEDYQVPVVVLSDKHLSESAWSTHFDTTQYENYQTSLEKSPVLAANGLFPRYQDTASGVSPRTIPGQKNGQHIANSYETDEFGLASEESQVRITQMDKRFKKVAGISSQITPQFVSGESDADISFVCFGSTKGPVQAAVEQLNLEGIKSSMLSLSWVWPFPTDQVISYLNLQKNPVIIEGNKTFQLAKLIRQETGIEIYHKRNKYDGRPFYPSEIIGFAREILGII